MGQGARIATPVLDRFAARIALTESGCIEWLGATNGGGYAQIKLSPSEGKRLVYVHRWSYEYHKGRPIPSGFQIDHLCRNTICVNPDHLEAVTPLVNSLRSGNPAKTNAQKSHCIHGHELTSGNTYLARGKWRTCRQCTKRRSRETYLRSLRKAP